LEFAITKRRTEAARFKQICGFEITAGNRSLKKLSSLLLSVVGEMCRKRATGAVLKQAVADSVSGAKRVGSGIGSYAEK